MKVNITLYATLAALALAGCEQFPGVVNDAKREVRRNLIDPSSAEFESVYQNSNTGAVCGLVNAKNRMGAYVGATPFVYEEGSGATLVHEPPRERDFERYFEMIRYSEASDYLALEDQCRAAALWQEKCESSIYPITNKYCLLVIEGKSMLEVYEAAKHNLK
ncbi:hypothetical protein [Arenimonas sp.]|uniref:hypothetical protein n=1 Tax=Arenimonas sp. TaxID=1872635 RepID=UPI0035B1C160